MITPPRLANRPIQGGRFVPWVALELPDGTYDLRACERPRVELCFVDGMCQVCGQRLGVPVVFFAGHDQLDDLLVDAPPVHPECAAYSAQACPMLAGRLTTYATQPTRAERSTECPTPGCTCGGYVNHGDPARAGTRAPRWFTVWCGAYDVVIDPDTQRVWGAQIPKPLKIRAVMPARLEASP